MDGLAKEEIDILPFLGSFNDDNPRSDLHLQTALVERNGIDHVLVFYL
jgi:hypothetical protein